MNDWLHTSDAESLFCPLSGRSCRGVMCQGWLTHPDAQDDRGRCGLLAALEGVLQR